MYVFYENDLVNKIIVTFHPIFKDLPESNVIRIDLDSYESDILDKLRENPNDVFVFIYSGTVFLKKAEDYDIRLISMTDNTELSESWYEYWSTSVSLVNNEEMVTALYNYYYKLPTKMERNMTENLNRSLNLDRYKFEEIVKSNSNTGLELQGRYVIESFQNNINRDKNRSIKVKIDDVLYTLCLTTYMESIYQLMDVGIEDLFMVDINLRSMNVRMTCVSKNNSFPRMLKPFVCYRRGIYTTVNITFEIFMCILCHNNF